MGLWIYIYIVVVVAIYRHSEPPSVKISCSTAVLSTRVEINKVQITEQVSQATKTAYEPGNLSPVPLPFLSATGAHSSPRLDLLGLPDLVT